VVTVSIKPDSQAKFLAGLKRFAKKTGQTLKDACLEQAALACQDAATFTPPLAKGGGKGLSKQAEIAGEEAVAGDIKKMFVSANDRYSKNAANVLAINLAYATRNNDIGMFNKLIGGGSMKAFKSLSPVMQRIANDQDYDRAFRKAKNYLNRTNLVLSDYGTIGFVFNIRPKHDEIKAKFGGRIKRKVKPVKKKMLVETTAELKEYIRERQKMVGRIKSGWASALRSLPKPVINGIPKNFGVDLLSVAWINKHTSVQGKNTVLATEKNVDVTVTNNLGNIANIATDASVLDLVYANRVKQMRARVKSHLNNTITEENSK
jgi:hypothetical protein